MKKRFSLTLMLPLTMLVLFISSCCSYDDVTLEEIRICGTSVGNLENAMCEEGLNSLSTSVESLTISALIGAHASQGSATFNLYISGETVPFRTSTIQLNTLDDDLDDKCEIWIAAGWPTGGPLPPSSWRAEVILNDGGTQTKTKDFSVQ